MTRKTVYCWDCAAYVEAACGPLCLLGAEPKMELDSTSVPNETASGATQQDHPKGLKTTDPVVLAVIAKLDERSAAGKLKYGTDLTRGDLSGLQWLKHLQEELLDAANYLQRIMNDVEQGR